jgi:hypothetical protein
MSEFFKSLFESMHRRATTAVVGTYATFWALFHWQVFYVMLFVDENKIYEKYGYLKNEYINIYFLNPRYSDVYYYLGFLLPALLTWLYIWKLPRWLFMPSFKEERRYKFEKQIFLLEEEKQLETKRTQLAVQSVKTLEEEKKVVKAEKEIIKLDPTKILDREYREFIVKTYARETLQEIKNTVYAHYGFLGQYTNPSSGYDGVNHTNPDYIAMAHTNGLIEFNNKNTQINLTEKGRYFLSKFN